jgi:hypothetical protein
MTWEITVKRNTPYHQRKPGNYETQFYLKPTPFLYFQKIFSGIGFRADMEFLFYLPDFTRDVGDFLFYLPDFGRGFELPFLSARFCRGC